MQKARCGVPHGLSASCSTLARRPGGNELESSAKLLVELLGQLHAANALVVALDGCGLLALALGSGLLVELARAQFGQQTQLFDGALEAAQGHVERLVFLDTGGGHVAKNPSGEICARSPCPDPWRSRGTPRFLERRTKIDTRFASKAKDSTPNRLDV